MCLGLFMAIYLCPESFRSCYGYFGVWIKYVLGCLGASNGIPGCLRVFRGAVGWGLAWCLQGDFFERKYINEADPKGGQNL